MSGRRAHPPRALGFTLIELLIALSLVGLIMVMLFGGLRLGGRTWEAVETKATRTEDLRLARGFLQRALTQARQVDWQVGQQIAPLFYGGPQQLEMTTPLAGFVGLGGLYLMRFAVATHEARHDLIVQRWMVHPDIVNGGPGIPAWQPLGALGEVQVPYDSPQGLYGTSLLVANVGEVVFSYFGRLPDNSGFDWQEQWTERPTPPLLVRVHLGAEAGWPDLVVRLPEAR